MPDDFDFVCDEIALDLARSQQAYGEKLADEIKARISVPVGYAVGPKGGEKKIRSKPGEPPRMDTGNLLRSIKAESISVGDQTSTAVSAGVDYAEPLQDKLDRPITSTMLEATESLLLDSLVEAIEHPS